MTSEIIASKPRADMQVSRDHSRFVRNSFELKAPSVLCCSIYTRADQTVTFQQYLCSVRSSLACNIDLF